MKIEINAEVMNVYSVAAVNHPIILDILYLKYWYCQHMNVVQQNATL